MQELQGRVDNLQRALDNRPLIEHAVGILMTIMGCSAPTAWESLRWMSQHTNRKVIDLAGILAEYVSGEEVMSPDVAGAVAQLVPPASTSASSPLTGADPRR